MKKFVKNLKLINPETGEEEVITGMMTSSDDPSLNVTESDEYYSNTTDNLFDGLSDEEIEDRIGKK